MGTSFKESLNVTVALTADGRTANTDGGNVKELRLSLQLFGFEGMIRIWVVAQGGADAFFDLACSPTLLEIELGVAKALYKASPTPAPLKLKGIVIARKLREISSADVNGAPVLYREYSFEFCDAARALWSQHRPCAVYAKTSLKKLLVEHTPAKLDLLPVWPELQKVRPLICLGLGMDLASFYDFVFWFADTEAGHLWYDYTKQALVFDAEKPSLGASRELAFGAITSTQSLQVTFAPPPRAAVQLLNSRDGATSPLSVEQPNAATGVRQDFLVHTPLNAESEARQATLKRRFATGCFDVHVECDAYPEMYLAPGCLLSLANELSQSLFVSGKTLRMLGLTLDARATDQTPEYDIENSTTEYDVELALDLEAKEDPRFRGSAYRTPRYPLRVEGKVLSAIGDTDERAYTVYAESDGSSTYKLQLALWNASVSIPVTPDFMPGHLYFPVYKDSRVFALLEFDSARIERFLDWGKDVTLPSASQGNQLLLGRSATSETSIKHWYVDNSPQLVIGRVNAGDFGTLTVKEGTLTLELTEEGSSSGFGATVSVEPQAQMAKVEASQKSDLAVADLEDTTQAASAELGGSARQATSNIQAQAEDLSASVNAKSRAVEQALADVGTSIDAQAEAARGALTAARQELEGLLK
jgi:hypothetical protein